MMALYSCIEGLHLGLEVLALASEMGADAVRTGGTDTVHLELAMTALSRDVGPIALSRDVGPIVLSSWRRYF